MYSSNQSRKTEGSTFSFKAVSISLVLAVLILSPEASFRVLANGSIYGSILVPVKIYFEGEAESGSIEEGTFLITSGTVTLGNLTFQVSTSPVKWYNGSINRVAASSGKLHTDAISLGNNYAVELAATYTNYSADTAHLAFGYVEPFPGSTAIRYESLLTRLEKFRGKWILINRSSRVIIFANATGKLTLSEGRVTISAQGAAIISSGPDAEGYQNGCLIVISKEPPMQGLAMGVWTGIFFTDGYCNNGWEDEYNYYLSVQEGGARIITYSSLNVTSGLAELEHGTITVSCSTHRTSIAYLVTRRIRELLEDFEARERASLREIGFDADKYLKNVEYTIIMLRESEEAFNRGDFEVGPSLLGKSLTKIKMSRDALIQAKTDCVAMFIFFIVFTFLLSSIVSAMVEKNRKLVSLGTFATIILAGVLFIPQVKMAVSILTPQTLLTLPPETLLLSLLTVAATLIVVGLLLFGAKSTLLRDLFWYSIKNMRRRMLRTTLTLVTITVISAVSGSLLTLGTIVDTREPTYPSQFHGASISSHTTEIISAYVSGPSGGGWEITVEDFFEPMSEPLVKWLSSMEWAEKRYVVATSHAEVSRRGIPFFPAVLLVATNASKLNGTAISANLAMALDVKEGDHISVNGADIEVSKVLDEPLTLIDEVPFDELEGRFFIMTDLEYSPSSMYVYRLILEGNVPPGFAERLVEMSYEKTEIISKGGSVSIFRSFRVCYGTGSEAKSLLIFGELPHLSGVIELLVLVGLSSLMILNMILGSFHERRGEYSTANVLGASPGQVSLLLFIEGLSYGLLGGVAGYVLGQFLQAYVPTPVTLVKPYVFSPLMASFLMPAIIAIVGSLVPAKKVILKIVPSRLLSRKIELKLFKNHAETMIPIRILEDADDFTAYVYSLTRRQSSSIDMGATYIHAETYKEEDKVKAIDLILSYKGERVAKYGIRLILPEDTRSTVKAIAYSADGDWGVDHRFCVRDALTVLREDLLQYVNWRKKISEKH